jgi:hypothetical protein
MISLQDTNGPANSKLYQWRSEGGVFRMALVNDAWSGFVNQNILVANASGNIGIGTSTPGSPLEIYSNQNGVAQIAINNPSSGGSAQAAFSFYEGATLKAKIGVNGSGNSSYVGGVNAFQIWNVQNAPVVVGTNSAERMRIDANGTVGIGTSTPNSLSKLDVNGQIRATSFVLSDGTPVGGGGGTITGVTAGTGLTGGGSSGALTLNVGAGTGVSVAADTISVNYGATPGTAVEGNKVLNVAAGNGMSVTGGAITLGLGGTVTLDNADRGSAQLFFKTIANSAGGPSISANANNDILTIAGAGGTTVSFSGKTITIDGSTSNISAAKVSAGTFGSGNYTYNGNVTVNGTVVGTNIKAQYQDLAEWVESSQELPAATVVVLDTSKSNQVVASTQPYDSRIAGVISNSPE